jgi:hypothetical protein
MLLFTVIAAIDAKMESRPDSDAILVVKIPDSKKVIFNQWSYVIPLFATVAGCLERVIIY